MTVILKTSVLVIAGLVVLSSEASAQYYTPPPVSQTYGQQPISGGFGLGLNGNGFNPNLGFGAGSVGVGVGAGIGRSGIGSGFNTGIGPIGATANGGLGSNGIGLATAAGIGNTGAAFDGGFSKGGLGIGSSAKILGFGPGASVGFGKSGPGLGASMAFGRLGTLALGSHRQTYPGAQQTAGHMQPNQNASYYTPQNYGRAVTARTVPVQNLNQVQSVPAQQPQYQYHVQQPQYRAPTCRSNWGC